MVDTSLTRIVQGIYKQGLYKIITEIIGAGELSKDCHISLNIKDPAVKSVQSALSDLLTTSATHGTFSRSSTKRGLILIGLELNTSARESYPNHKIEELKSIVFFRQYRGYRFS